MLKFIIGCFLFPAGLILSFIPPFIWGPILIVVAVGMISAGTLQLGWRAAKGASRLVKASNHQAEPAPQSLAPLAPAPTVTLAHDTQRWRVLCEVDQDIRTAADHVAPFGSWASTQLATKFLALNDKTYLSTLVENIEKEAAVRADKAQEAL